MNIFILLCLICIPIDICASIEHYLKPVVDKSDISVMRNIDYIYMINLDERPEKFRNSCEQLSKYGITPHRFSAVNGWMLPLSTINALGVTYTEEMCLNDTYLARYFVKDGIGLTKEQMPWISKIEPMRIYNRTYFCHEMKLGAIGCILSHLSILKDAYDSGYETIWVMEDDIEIIKDPNLLSDLILDLDEMVGPNNWDILYTDRESKNQQGHPVFSLGIPWRPNFAPRNPHRFVQQISLGKFKKVGARFGTYSMILRRSGIFKILQHFQHYHLFLPYDVECTMPDTMQVYTVQDEIVSTMSNAATDNALPSY